MAKVAFVLGGTGQTGRALVPRFAERGWEVVVASRGERAVPDEPVSQARFVRLDRSDTRALRAAVGDGVDVLVDIVAFRPEDAERPGTRVLNCGDPDPPTVLEIERAIAAALDHDWVKVLIPGAAWERG